ncbi:MAG: NifU family protein [Thermoleophilaceae bacterium]|nr:NifU family protein [Thermoleophilaceae bacterium]
MSDSLQITDAAYDKVMSFIAGAPEPERQAMWIEVTGADGGEWVYEMSLKPLDQAGSYDAVIRHRDLAIVVPEADWDKVRGSTIDWLDDPFGRGGLRLDNPNKVSPAIGERPLADLSGDVPQRVVAVLEQQINPAIAAHGGRASLVAVEEGTAYLRLEGGCVGCGMASVTLGQGIEVAIKQSVPEIERVVDVTDHASGTNPYYEPEKK